MGSWSCKILKEEYKMKKLREIKRKEEYKMKKLREIKRRKDLDLIKKD